ncbi:hypothetical protein MRB53_027055 [Persea americana]|uniref:Uncharacterized protein n=1 Tax=Persea americana TaxID=3435 RepID=A0ACC2LKZ9_PERAE|nr:hypothetical protein MRB53_027055 [Persea americana]
MVTKSQIMGLLDNGVMELDLREMGLLFIGKRAGAVQNTWGQIGLIVTGDMSLVGDDVISRPRRLRPSPTVFFVFASQSTARVLKGKEDTYILDQHRHLKLDYKMGRICVEIILQFFLATLLDTFHLI